MVRVARPRHTRRRGFRAFALTRQAAASFNTMMMSPASDAPSVAHDLLITADGRVVTPDDLFDLPLRASSVIYQDSLTFLQTSHGRFALE